VIPALFFGLARQWPILWAPFAALAVAGAVVVFHKTRRPAPSTPTVQDTEQLTA